MHWSPIAWCSNNSFKYIMMMVWLSVNAIVFWQTYVYYKHAPQFYYLHGMLGAGLCVSRATANVANLNLGMLLLPVCRATMATLRALPIPMSRYLVKTLVDHCKGFHILCAYTLITASVLHFFGHVFNAVSFSENYNTIFEKVNAASYPKQNPLWVVLGSFPGVTGVIMLLLLLLILSSSAAAIRRSTYEIFWYTHRLFIIFYTFVIFHGFRGILKAQTNLLHHQPGCFRSNVTVAYPEPEPELVEPEVDDDVSSCSEPPNFDTIGAISWIWVTVPLFLYACDVMYRYVTKCRTSCHVVGLAWHHSDVIELHIHKEAFQARAGQFILLQCPSISVLESHPYTITKVPTIEDPVLTVHIRVSGDWSARLKETLFDEQELHGDTDSLVPETAYNCRISVEGPFASPLEDCLSYPVSLWVAGGIGVTPFVAHLQSLRSIKSCCTELMAKHIGELVTQLDKNVRRRIHRIYFIWLCRDYDTFLVFAQLLCDIYEMFWEDNRPDAFQVSLHLTSEDNTGEKVELGERFRLLDRRVHQGRPCWKGLLTQIANSHPRTAIGAFTCGPKSLVMDISHQCSDIRRKGTTFHYHKESF